MAEAVPDKIPNPIPYVLAISLGSNAFVLVAVNVLMNRVSRTAWDQQFHDAILSSTTGYFLTYILPTGFGLAAAWIQMRPLIEVALDPQKSPFLVQVRRCALRTPLYQGLIAFTAWAVGDVGFFLAAILKAIPFTWAQLRDWTMATMAHATLGSIISYYVMEYAVRRWFIPRLFPEGRLAELSQGTPLSVRARMFIFYVAVCIYPTFLGYRILRSQVTPEHFASLSPELELTLGGVMLLCGVLTWVLGTAYQRPLVRMKGIVGQLRAGDYNVRVDVASDDEVGALGDGLNEMAAGLRDAEKIKSAFGRVVDPAVRDFLLRGNMALGGELREAGILFADIRGFTALSEALRPPEVVTLLNRYFDRMGKCIEAEGGVVNKYIGDAIMALFGVPLPIEGPAAAAVRAGMRMRVGLKELNGEFANEGLPLLHMGIGVHFGPVLAGNIGSATRMEYTVIGDAVNLASRVEGLCKRLHRELLVTRDVWLRLNSDIPAKYLEAHGVRGRSEKVHLYAIG